MTVSTTEVAIKKLEMRERNKLAQLAILKEVGTVIAPPLAFTGIWLGIDWLTNHKNPQTDDWYLTPRSGELLVTALGAAFVANAFGAAKLALK